MSNGPINAVKVASQDVAQGCNKFASRMAHFKAKLLRRCIGSSLQFLAIHL
jgi:hypothetical protein